jgi:hypothetical protein
MVTQSIAQSITQSIPQSTTIPANATLPPAVFRIRPPLHELWTRSGLALAPLRTHSGLAQDSLRTMDTLWPLSGLTLGLLRTRLRTHLRILGYSHDHVLTRTRPRLPPSSRSEHPLKAFSDPRIECGSVLKYGHPHRRPCRSTTSTQDF